MTHPASSTPSSAAAHDRAMPAADRALTLIDCDVHQTWTSARELLPYLDPYFAQYGVRMPGSPYFSPLGVSRMDAKPEQGGPPGSCLQTMQRQHLDAFGIDYAVLNGGGILGLGTSPDFDYAAALARAYNDWMIEHWLDKDGRLRASLVIAPQDAQQAAAEIRRVGNHRRIVQVLMCSASAAPYGQRQFHPIYEAAAELGLPVALHPGTEGRGITGPPTGVGWPRNYLEWHTNLSQTYMAHLTSLVCEGVFEKFPTLHFVCLEGGLAWLPHLMWRMDKNWKALRTQRALAQTSAQRIPHRTRAPLHPAHRRAAAQRTPASDLRDDARRPHRHVLQRLPALGQRFAHARPAQASRRSARAHHVAQRRGTVWIDAEKRVNHEDTKREEGTADAHR